SARGVDRVRHRRHTRRRQSSRLAPPQSALGVAWCASSSPASALACDRTIPDRAVFLAAVSKAQIDMMVRNVVSLAAIVVAGVVSPFCPPPKTIAKPVDTALPPATRDIEALIERGCYRCLTQALELAKGRGLAELAFEAASLLTLRAGELGIPRQEWLTQ